MLSQSVNRLGRHSSEAAPAMSAYAAALLKAQRVKDAQTVAQQALDLRNVDGKLMDAPECVNLLLLVMGQLHLIRDGSKLAESSIRQSLSMAERLFGGKFRVCSQNNAGTVRLLRSLTQMHSRYKQQQ